MNPRANKYSVFNLREQPVEIHFESRVLVLEPGGCADIAEPEANSEHLKALRAMQAIAVQAAPAAETETRWGLPRDKGGPAAKDEKQDSSRQRSGSKRHPK